MALYRDKRSPEQQKLVKDTADRVSAHLARMKAPAGKPETNWIKTIPGKGWFTYFRLYGPTQAYFDRSWVLPDIETVK